MGKTVPRYRRDTEADSGETSALSGPRRVSSDIRNRPLGDMKNWPPVDVHLTSDGREGLSR